jgi:putative transposase
MTVENVELNAVLGKVLQEGHKDELLSILLTTLQQIMSAEANELCNADYRARTEERRNSRNGYRPRPFETRLGGLELQIPKLRQGSYLPSFINPRRRWEKAFVNVVSEAYVLGVSTRKVESLVEAMGAKGISKSEVSRMAVELDKQVSAFRERRLDAVKWPYVWLDALYIKVRENGNVVSKAVLVAYGVNELGEREVLGVDVAASEMEESWKGFIEGLVRRGLRGVMLVISDAHSGLRAAISKVLLGASWQRCIVHFLRNVLSHLPRKAQAFAAAAVKNIFHQQTQEAAREAVGKALELLEPKYPAAAQVVREAEDDVLAYMNFPTEHWRQIKSSNPLERLNKEIRRRTDVVGIFPNDASLLRLVTMLLIEQNDEWAVGRRYFSMESMAKLTGSGATPPLLGGR